MAILFTLTFSSAYSAEQAAPVTTPVCAEKNAVWTVGPEPEKVYSAHRFGKYAIQNDVWGWSGGLSLWAVNRSCWGVSTNWDMEPSTMVRGYPSVVRGWIHNGEMLTPAFSTPGTQDWTWKGSNMGKKISALTQAKARWSFTPPLTTGLRWGALMDVYMHRTREPDYDKGWPPEIDLMINQALMDQPFPDSVDWRDRSFYAWVAHQAHPSVVTLGGVTYLMYIDEPGDIGFHRLEQDFKPGMDFDKDGVSMRVIKAGPDTDGNGIRNVTLAGITEAPGEWVNNNNGIPEQGEVVLGFGKGKAIVRGGTEAWVRSMYGIAENQMILLDLEDDLNSDFNITAQDSHMAYHRSNPNAAKNHTIHMFQTPTQYTQNGTGALWGSYNSLHNLKAIIDFFRGTDGKNWKADNGKTITFADGTPVTAPILSDDLYLNSVQAGMEPNNGTFTFTNRQFCVSVQNEAPCL